MKFKNRATGETYLDIHDARRAFCAGRFCPECQMQIGIAETHADSCTDFAENHMERAAELMSFEVIKDYAAIEMQYAEYCSRCKHHGSDYCTQKPECFLRFDANLDSTPEEPSKFEPKAPEESTKEEPPAAPEETQRHFETGAVRDNATGKGRYDLLPWGAIHALAQHQERGAVHYGERNVDKGIPQSSLIDSAIRHLSMYIQGDAEPYHLVAALWNIAWACEQEIKRPEMIDLPERTEKSGKAV